MVATASEVVGEAVDVEEVVVELPELFAEMLNGTLQASGDTPPVSNMTIMNTFDSERSLRVVTVHEKPVVLDDVPSVRRIWSASMFAASPFVDRVN